MSLINDALKRAQEAQRPHSSPRLASLSSLSAPPSQPQKGSFPSRARAVLLLLLMAGGLLWAGLSLPGIFANKKTILPPVPPPAILVAAPPVADVPSPPASPAASTPPLEIAAPAPEPLALADSLRLQGIVFDSVQPWAIVSGKTVYIGSLIKGWRVTAITRDSVTVGNNNGSLRLGMHE